MAQPDPKITIRFSTTAGHTYRVDLAGPSVGDFDGEFTPPYYVAHACRGDTALGRQLSQLTQQMAGDPNQPQEHRALGRVLTRILAGERTPDLSALPPELAQAVQEMLDSLAGPPRMRRRKDLEPNACSTDVVTTQPAPARA